MGSSSGAVSMMLMTSSRTWRRYSNTSLSGGHLNEPPIRQFSWKKKNFSRFTRFVKFYCCINSYNPCCLIIFNFTYCSVQCVMNHRDNLNVVGATFTYLSVLTSPTCNCQRNMKLSFFKSGGIKTGRKILVAMPTLLGKGLHRLWQHAHNYLHDLSLRNIILFCTLMWYTQLFLV